MLTRVKVPKGSTIAVLHTKVASAKFVQLLRSGRVPGCPPNEKIPLRADCTEVEVWCEGPCELEWFP